MRCLERYILVRLYYPGLARFWPNLFYHSLRELCWTVRQLAPEFGDRNPGTLSFRMLPVNPDLYLDQAVLDRKCV